MVSQAVVPERQARVTADDVTVSNLNALRAQVGVTEAGALTEGFILNETDHPQHERPAIVSAGTPRSRRSPGSRPRSASPART